ncbi:hypothetical protein [Stieleria varia]|uniref:Uncharacterized protein n=1 Tax=Stieleria varia TaxID=2528005 RepID=A0A5C5ZL06_9BACT|nr:hypothetical protein [Stieleria varia]TWT87868.1 hypothetical protein Pla52n_69760 [Stieleria varia]
MSIYRNRFFLAGILLILLGTQFRMIDSVVLNEPTTRALAKFTNTPIVDNSTTMGSIFSTVTPKPTKRLQPPRWLGLALIAVGTVISLHAFALPQHKKGGD